MKHFRQNVLVATLILLASFVLMACTSSLQPTPEPQEIAPVIPAQPTVPKAEPAVVVEPAGRAHAAPVEAAAKVEPVVSTTFVERWSDGTLVEGTESTLVRMEHGLYMTFITEELEPGDAVTIWWVIFNKPENCSEGDCGVDDVVLVDETGTILKNDEGAPQPNVAGRTAAGVAQLTATGTVVDEDGSAKFLARLPVGDTNDAQFGPGLLNPMTADVHLVARTHGPASPGVLHEQLTTPWGGCPDGWPKAPCGNVQVAVHSLSES